MLFNFTSYSFSFTTSYPSPVNHLHFPSHGFLIFNLSPHHSPGAHPDSQAHNPQGWGFSVLHFIQLEVPRDPRPCEHPTPPGKDGSQARGGRGLQEKKARTVRVATRERLQEVARSARESASATVHLFQSGGLDTEANPPLGRPIPSPAREKPEEAAASPLGSPENALQLPTSGGDPHEGAGPRRRRLTLAMLAPARSHMDFYNLAWPRLWDAGRSRSDQERETEERGQRGQRGEAAGSAASAERRGRAGRGRGGGARRSPDTRARGRSPRP